MNTRVAFKTWNKWILQTSADIYILVFVLNARETSVSWEIKAHKSTLFTLPVYLSDTLLC